jgi:hypothetical protein
MSENDQSNSLIPQTKILSGTQGEIPADCSPSERASMSTKTMEGEGGKDSRDKRCHIKVGAINRVKDVGKPSFVKMDDHGENCTER